MEMKKHIIILSFLFINAVAFGQYDPFVSNTTVTPAPFKYVGQTGQLSMTVGNNGRCPMNRQNEIPCDQDDCKYIVKICLNRTASVNTIEPLTGTNPSSALNSISGTFAGKFNWTYFDGGTDANCFIGIQKPSPTGDIGAFSSGTILINIVFSQPSTSANPLDGFKVNVVPTYYSQGAVVNSACVSEPVGGNNTGDDFASIYTYLPINLLNFNANYLGNKNAKIEWTTISELNSLEFEIQSKGDKDNNWITKGRVPAAGNSSQKREYNFVDEITEFSDKVYYRIKMIDLNGSFTYTDIKSVKLKLTGIQVDGYPNPVKNNFNIIGFSEFGQFVEIQISDITGKVLFKNKVSIVKGNFNHKINMAAFAPGSYFLTVNNDKIVEKITILKVE